MTINSFDLESTTNMLGQFFPDGFAYGSIINSSALAPCSALDLFVASVAPNVLPKMLELILSIGGNV